MSEAADADLTDGQRELLARGLSEWGGPAKPTDAIAQVLGCADVAGLRWQGASIALSIGAGEQLDSSGWHRALLATEVASRAI